MRAQCQWIREAYGGKKAGTQERNIRKEDKDGNLDTGRIHGEKNELHMWRLKRLEIVGQKILKHEEARTSRRRSVLNI